MWNLLKVLFKYLDNQSGQVPSNRSEDYDAVLTSSLREIQPRLRDNITRSNKVVSWLESKGRMRRVDGGERIQVALMHQQNSAADIYSGYGTLDTTPQDGITSAFYPWSQLAVPISISRKERSEERRVGKECRL